MARLRQVERTQCSFVGQTEAQLLVRAKEQFASPMGYPVYCDILDGVCEVVSKRMKSLCPSCGAPSSLMGPTTLCNRCKSARQLIATDKQRKKISLAKAARV